MAKGYTWKEEINYEETFSSVAIFKYIWILLIVAISLNYEIWQMDIKIAFLYGNIEECIYIRKLEGFIAKSQKYVVCKLKKSIYSLM